MNCANKRNSHKAKSKSERDCFVATLHVCKMGTLSPLSKRLRNSPVPLMCLCTGFSTTAKSLLSCLISRSAKLPTTLLGEVRAKRRDCLPSSAACSAAWKKVTEDCCCSWLRRWRGRRPIDREERLAFSGSLLPHPCPSFPLRRSYFPASRRERAPLAVLGRRRICARQFSPHAGGCSTVYRRPVRC